MSFCTATRRRRSRKEFFSSESDGGRTKLSGSNRDGVLSLVSEGFWTGDGEEKDGE